jgi:hypothetical protein
MSLSPIYMTLTPMLTLSHRRQVKDNFIILQKIEYSDIFRCHSGYRQRTEFQKQSQKAYFQTVVDISLISV